MLGMTPRIAVIGDVMLDIEAEVQPRPNYERADGCFIGSEWQYLPGGAANVAAILAALGADVTCFGAVADDWAGQILRSLLPQEGRHLANCLDSTTVKFRAREGPAIRCRVDREGRWIASAPFPRDICYANRQDFDAVVFSDYCKGMFTQFHAPSVSLLIERCNEANIPTIVDPHPCGHAQMWQEATIATPAERELFALTLWRCRYTAVTLREKGCDLYQGSEKLGHFEAEFVEAPQVVGAGDALTAAIATALAYGQSVWEAVQYGVDVAARYVANPRVAGLAEVRALALDVGEA